ncbi:NADPH-dependent FMN reductase [Acididesulfobacillus acetoxydans]|uniref:Iron-sulfur flavoprotein MJ0731 n=1 Tax=Acididesulfobacillus acetoxydans TaxID=1561005 RepID=A0A8S0XWH7_9FIRM|nr:flavodoxin family protein [Acididesulfobacillus acetoxydans]CAA7601047.1 NADPH-dependent FMN reductase [Acididesulfobacillus acetoxydans]CEJ06921.1 Iron-sulfur flavoprotein MJ0731 [Acididesulfobacillus acetoxydans]
MARILGISGSPRKAATYYCVEEALAEVRRHGIEVEFFALAGKQFSLCIHCDRCLKANSLECVRSQDDLSGWATKFLEFDGYIIGSPVYDMNISAQLQGFFNRMRANWLILEKNPDFYARKFGGAIAVGGTRHGGQELVLNALNNYYLSLGIKVVSAGAQAYNGAAVWSKDRRAEGVKEDHIGVESVRAIGRAVALAVKNEVREH